MFNIMLRFEVADFERWKAQFDADEGWRRDRGEQKYHIYRDTDDPRMVTVMLGWDSIDTGQVYVNSPQLRRQLQDGGVIGGPTYVMMNDVEEAA